MMRLVPSLRMREHGSSSCLCAVLVAFVAAPLAAQPAASVAWVSSVVQYPLEAAELDSLPPEVIARLEAAGMTLNRAARRLESPELPLVGFWFELGPNGRRFMTDERGYLETPTARPATNVKVYAQAYDLLPVAVVPSIRFVPEGQEPSPTLLTFEYRPIANMSPEADVPIADLKLDHRSVGAGIMKALFQFPSPTPPASCVLAYPRGVTFEHRPIADLKLNHRSVGARIMKALFPFSTPPASCVLACPRGACCLDYDAPHGNHVRYKRPTPVTCGTPAVYNFIDSTCYGWTFFKPVRACLLEKAILQFVGPACVTNHKYRYCQTMDEKAFAVSPATSTVASGARVEIAVRNRTPGNTTCVSFNRNPGSAGAMELRAGAPRVVRSAACGGYELEHFDDRGKKHINDAKVVFKAPVLPANACEETFVIALASGGIDKTSTIKVTNPTCASRNWSGSFDCSVEVSGAGYNHKESQHWELEGKPRIEGPRAIYTATWTANGNGSYTSMNAVQSRHAEGTSRPLRGPRSSSSPGPPIRSWWSNNGARRSE